MQQLALTLEPGLAQKYRDLRECFAACVYRVGLGRVAAMVDQAPSNLSAMISGDRHLPTDVVERFMQGTSDTTPALFIAARYLQDAKTVQQQALAQLPGMVAQLNTLIALAGKGA
jgi:hypothetical protein